MAAYAKFVNKEVGMEFEAVIDQETSDWVVVSGFTDQRDVLAAELNYLAPKDGNYIGEELDNQDGDLASVIHPAGWYRALRLKGYYPDGEVVIYYEDEGGGSIDGQIVY